ncbi:MAG: NUDIX domain-containing protein [Clostridia bacterium]|nr:NUDIX domain-containing protein [Clostridia bacterium]
MDYIKYMRAMIGNKPMFLVGAGTLILNKKNQLLLMKRSDNHMWSTLGGSLNLGETFEEAAIREAYEEGNIKIRNLSLFTLISGKEYYHVYPNGDQVYNTCAIFWTRDYEGNLEVDFDETLDLKFFDLNDLPENINPPDKIFILQFVKQFEEGRIK